MLWNEVTWRIGALKRTILMKNCVLMKTNMLTAFYIDMEIVVHGLQRERTSCFYSLNEDVESHFKTLKIKLPDINGNNADLRTEKGLILDRVNSKLNKVPDDAKIFPKYRHRNGIYYDLRGTMCSSQA